jgi:hypothetical protein
MCWCRWILLQPYKNEFLTEQWVNYLAVQEIDHIGEDSTLAKRWAEIISDFPADESKESKDAQKGTYLNALFWDRTAARAADLIGIVSSQNTLDNCFDGVRAIRRGNTRFQAVDTNLDERLFDVVRITANYSSDTRTPERQSSLKLSCRNMKRPRNISDQSKLGAFQ